MSMLRLHDALVGRAVLGGVLAVWSVILGLDLVFALMADFDRIGQGDYGAATEYDADPGAVAARRR